VCLIKCAEYELCVCLVPFVSCQSYRFEASFDVIIDRAGDSERDRMVQEHVFRCVCVCDEVPQELVLMSRFLHFLLAEAFPAVPDLDEGNLT
jgi:hypothetical protein